MEFIFETTHDLAALTDMSRALRKTYRKVKSLVIRLICVAFFCVGVYFSTPLSGREFSWELNSVLSNLALIMLLICVLCEDSMNGRVARSKLDEDDVQVTAKFTEEGYSIETAARFENWQYDWAAYLVETKYYFVIVFDKHRAQVFDKDNLSGGTEDEFRFFLEEKTGKKFIIA